MAVIEHTKRNSLVPFIAHFASVKNEEAISPESYSHLLESHLQPFHLHPDIQTYLRFHLLRQPDLDAKECTYILSYESVGCAIDYYEAFVHLAAMMCRRSFEDFKEYVAPSVRCAAESIEDPRLALLLATLPGGEVPPRLVPRHQELIDMFLSGRYTDCASATRGALAANADEPELIELLARCGVLNPDSCPSPPSSSLNLQVAERMRSVIARDDRAEENLSSLSKLGTMLEGHDIGEGINAFCVRERSSECNAEACHLTPPRLFPPRPFPLHAGAFPERNKQAFLDALRSANPSALGTAFAEAVITNSIQVAPLSSLDPRHLVLLEADLALRNGDFDTALIKADCFAESEMLYFRNKAIRIRLSSLLKLNRIEDCLKVEISVYFTNTALHQLLPLKDLAEKLDRRVRRELSPLIAVPISFEIYSHHISTDLDEIKQFSFEDFLISHGVDRPSGLRELADRFEKQDILYFLRNVCVPNIMDGCPTFQSTKALEDERLLICELLTQLDPDNRDDYHLEIED